MKDQNGQAAKQLTTAPGSNIYLRPWELRDAPSLAQYANNPRIAASLRDDFPSPYTLNDANRFIAMATGRSSARSLPGSPAGSSCRSSSRLLLAIAVEGIAVGGGLVFICWTMSTEILPRLVTGWENPSGGERASLPLQSLPRAGGV